MIDRNRLRGRLVRAGRAWLTEPCRRRFPFSVYRRVHAALRRRCPARFTDADPFTVVAIDPGRITDSVLAHSPKHPQWGRVVGGEWDRQCRPFVDRPVVRGLVQHFEEGIPWADTRLYEAFRDQLDRFGNAWGYTSLAGFQRRCREIERLYDRIDRDGYRSQRSLGSADAPATPVLDEVNVDVGRDGRLLWRAYGQHRLAIAQLLDVPEIPVLVHRRHRGWQRVRDAVRRGHRSPEPPVHPDLRDLATACGRPDLGP